MTIELIGNRILAVAFGLALVGTAVGTIAAIVASLIVLAEKAGAT